jgi:MOSC domain-containing protein YiiM
MVKRFHRSGRSGFYFAVVREGALGAGDSIERLARDEHGLTVADVVRLYAADEADQSLLERASQHPALPAGWREYFRKRLWEPDT